MIGSVEIVGRFEAHTMPDGSVVYYDPDPAHAYYGEISPSKSARGGYAGKQASRLTGASTIAKFLDSNPDPLMWWAVGLDQVGIAELAEEDMRADRDVTWLTSHELIRDRLKEEKRRWSDVRDRSAEVGTNVHEQVFHALARGETPNLADRTEAERGFAQAAIGWWMDTSPKVIAAEQVTVNYATGFAGRFDLLCEIEGERVLVDAKTRVKGVDRKADHVQLPGYEEANVACGIGASDRQLILVLKPDGTYNAVPSVGTREDFQAALIACKAGRSLDKRLREAATARREEMELVA
jgi:hypothetical protein